MQKNRIFFVIGGIIIVAVIIGIIFLAFQASANFRTYSNEIATLQSQNNTLQIELSSAKSQIATMTNQISTLQTGISSSEGKLTTDLSSVKAQVATLANQVNNVDSQIASLKNTVSSSSSTITSLQGQVTTLNSQLTTLQTTLTSLQSSVTSLTTRVTNLETSGTSTSTTTLFSSQYVSQNYNTRTNLRTYTPTNSGYFSISGTSSSNTAYIRVHNNSLGTYNDYSFGTGTTVTANVIGGYSYSIMFGNTNFSGTVTATLTATYHPSSYTGGQITLFAGQTISQSYNSQTTLTEFVPDHFGYVYITGNSSTSTGYIRVYNNTLGTYNNYTFGTGTTVTAPVSAGYSYSIIFGNTNSSGTITATLTATYYRN
ncbi:hypothetical protein ACFLXC_05810 [Chloroflexota bacterium]